MRHASGDASWWRVLNQNSIASTVLTLHVLEIRVFLTFSGPASTLRNVVFADFLIIDLILSLFIAVLSLNVKQVIGLAALRAQRVSSCVHLLANLLRLGVWSSLLLFKVVFKATSSLFDLTNRISQRHLRVINEIFVCGLSHLWLRNLLDKVVFRGFLKSIFQT